MRHRYATITIGFTALVMALAVLIPGEASSASVENDTHLRFDHPVCIPGATLPAGSYVFQLDEDRQAVWIFSESNGDVFGPYLVIPRYRIEATRRVVILGRPRNAGDVPAVRAWFGRDRNDGREFVYAANDRD